MILPSMRDLFSIPAAKVALGRGEAANFSLLPMIGERLDQLLSWGVENISKTLGQTTSKINKIAEQYGLFRHKNGPHSPHYLSLQIPKGTS